MSCQHCEEVKDIKYLVTKLAEDELPVAPECAEPEECDVVQPAGCVIYEDEDLPIADIKQYDRINTIIKKLALTITSTTQAISTQNSDTVILTGNGTVATPLTAEAKIDAVAGNALQKTVAGLKVVATKEFVTEFLTVIKDNVDLQPLFCELVSKCGDQVCGIISGLNSEVN